MKYCDECGSTERLQTHHILYQPPFPQVLCTKCHQEKHNGQYTGPPKGFSKRKILLERWEKKFDSMNLFDLETMKVAKFLKRKEGATRRELVEAAKTGQIKNVGVKEVLDRIGYLIGTELTYRIQGVFRLSKQGQDWYEMWNIGNR